MAELLAYGTITIGGSESESRPACGAEPIVDVILDRLQPTLVLSLPGGSGASFSVSLSPVSTDQGGETWGVQSVSVTNGGSGYADGTRLAIGTAVGVPAARLVEESEAVLYANVTNGSVTSVTVDSSGEYFMTGGVESVELVHGGAFYRNPLCTYASDEVCVVCPGTDDTLKAYIALGAQSHTFTLTRKDYYDFGGGPRVNETTILQATRPAVDENGAAIPCTSLKFEPEHFSEQYSCVTNGTVTVSQGACGDSSQSGCDLPDQIQITVSGKDRAFGYGRQSFGAPPPGDPFGGECGDYENVCRFTPGGSAVGPSTWGGSLVAGGTAILDRQPGCNIVYSGFLPDAPSAGGFSGQIGNVDCGGGLEAGGRPVTVSINPAGLGTSVVISPPTKQAGYAATAEVTATSGAGAITAVAITNGGEGYAREVFERTEPTMTVTLSGSSGSGVAITATLTQSGAGEEAYWYVSAVSVTNGGTGYSGQESVVFTPETGTTTDSPASAVVSVGRIEPTLTASASPGSGADLSITLGEGVDWFTGQANWYVESVAVDDGGTGYVDGDNVTFTVTDGVQSWAASATIATGRTLPDVTAEVQFGTSGTGAVLTPTLSASGNSWTVSGVTITAAGSGYSQWEYISFVTDDLIEASGIAYITSVDGNGSITGVAIDYGGAYYRSTGVIQSVAVNDGGSYYKSTGVVEAITLWEGGAYYKEESTGTSDVDVPLVAFGSQIGFGATATATVDGTLGSPTFGQITAIQITSGGQDYKTSGSGWKITIAGAASAHRDELLAVIGYDPTFGTPVDPNETCANLVEYAEQTATRTTDEPCPSDLLSRAYNMFDSFIIFPNFFEDQCGATYCISGQFSNRVTIVDYGGGDITCELSPV